MIDTFVINAWGARIQPLQTLEDSVKREEHARICTYTFRQLHNNEHFFATLLIIIFIILPTKYTDLYTPHIHEHI